MTEYLLRLNRSSVCNVANRAAPRHRPSRADRGAKRRLRAPVDAGLWGLVAGRARGGPGRYARALARRTEGVTRDFAAKHPEVMRRLRATVGGVIPSPVAWTRRKVWLWRKM